MRYYTFHQSDYYSITKWPWFPVKLNQSAAWTGQLVVHLQMGKYSTDFIIEILSVWTWSILLGFPNACKHWHWMNEWMTSLYLHLKSKKSGRKSDMKWKYICTELKCMEYLISEEDIIFFHWKLKRTHRTGNGDNEMRSKCESESTITISEPISECIVINWIL